MRIGRLLLIALLIASACGVLLRADVRAQTPSNAPSYAPSYTMAVRGLALADAIERFVNATGIAVSYDPDVVRGHTASCATEASAAEDVLRCILKDSRLDFYRLSSGTYVLTRRVEVAPARGYLAGRVYDGATGSPLPGAHVLLADAGYGAVADRSGRFTMPALLPGSYVITVSHLGYRPWSDSLFVSPQGQVEAEAALEAEPIFITPVVVDGLQADPPSRSLGRPSVRADEGGPPTVRASLPALSGVRLSDVTSDVHLQGGDAGSLQLRLDGAPVFLPYSMAGFAGPFSSLALERLTVHKAGFGASVGSQLGGVVDAEHALAPVDEVDLQVDPYSFNGRLRLADGDRLAAMVSARTGLWDVVTPSAVKSTLTDWAQPDAFLLLGGLPDREALALSGSQLAQLPGEPSLHYSDVHAAGRVRFTPLRSLHASFYRGGQAMDFGVTDWMDGIEGREFRPVTVSDHYDWSNGAGQVRYDAVIGSRALARLQLRTSSYRLSNRYQMLDTLTARFERDESRLLVSTRPVEDENRVTTYAVEGSVDYALDGHHVTASLETGAYDSRFSLQSVYFPSRATSQLTGEHAEESYTFRQGAVVNDTRTWYAAASGEDRIRISDRLDAEIGVRLTYLGVRSTVYAEPRLALAANGVAGLGGWSTRTAAGLYRQFLSQTDASKLNAGSLLSAVRVWLPVDESVRPPLAYHVSQEAVLRPTERWTLRLDAYLKHQPRGLALAYAQADTLRFVTGVVDQDDILVRVRETVAGGSAGVEWQGEALRAGLRYSYEHSSRRSRSFFEGKRHPAPWTQPHRLEVSVDWKPAERIALTARGKGVWNRPWGFRRVYYDYFGHSEDSRYQDEFDLGDPSAHVLPAIYQLDLGGAYTQPIGRVDLQIRAELLNVLDRENVLDWRLVKEGSRWKRETRTLYPFMPSLAVRLRGF